MSYPEFVDARETRFFEKNEILIDGKPHLHLKALVMHSALAVKSVEVSPDGQAVWVKVRLTPATKGLSGRFELNVPLSNLQQTVVFGPLKTVIWPTVTPLPGT